MNGPFVSVDGRIAFLLRYGLFVGAGPCFGLASIVQRGGQNSDWSEKVFPLIQNGGDKRIETTV